MYICISDLLEKIHNSSNKPNPKCELLQGIWDFKKWIEPFQGSIDNHSKYHVFRFTKGSTSKVEMHYKHFSSDPWQPEGVGKYLVEVCSILYVDN